MVVRCSMLSHFLSIHSYNSRALFKNLPLQTFFYILIPHPSSLILIPRPLHSCSSLILIPRPLRSSLILILNPYPYSLIFSSSTFPHHPYSPPLYPYPSLSSHPFVLPHPMVLPYPLIHPKIPLPSCP